MKYLRQSTGAIIAVGPFLSKADGVTAITTLTYTSTLNGRIFTNGAGQTYTPFNNQAWLYDANGFYAASLVIADIPSIGQFRLEFSDPTTFLPVWEDFTVLSAAVYDSLFGTSALPTVGTGTNQIALSSGGKISEVALVDTLTTYTGNTPQSGDVYAIVAPIATGTAANGSPTTLTLASGDTAVAGTYNGDWIRIVGGTGANQSRYIETHVTSPFKLCTVSPAWATAPNNTSQYEIFVRGANNIVAWNGAPVVTSTYQAGVPVVEVGYTNGAPLNAASGYVGIDWANIHAPGTTVNLSGTTINTAALAPASTALSTAQWTNALATNLSTLAGHDPGATLGTSTLTQTQITGGAYNIQSASCVLGDARIAHLDADVSSRMATYTQPTGFLAATFPGSVAGTITDAAPTVNGFVSSSGLSATVNLYVNAFVSFRTGALVGVAHAISASSAAGGITFKNPLPAAPADGDTFVILGGTS